MQKIITSYLVQKKECSLPGIGHFRISTKPAELDIANKQLLPPTDEIFFLEEEVHLRKDLVTYVSTQQKIQENIAAENIAKWCQETKDKLDTGEKIHFQSLGTLEKDEVGNILFHMNNEIHFFEAVPAERIIHKNEEHSVLVGDRETTSVAMNEFYREDPVIEKKSWWRIWAIVLFSLSLLVLIIHFSNHKFTTIDVGNQIHLSTEIPPVLYNAE
ncbi:MAG: hypothetical protein ABIO81_09380 [Ginsengibacter sp.]